MLRWLPENVSTFGKEIDSLFYLIYYVTGAVFILVTVLMLLFLIRYRHREGRRAIYTHGNTALEITWTVIPAAILLALTFISASTWANIKARNPPADVQVQVTAKQFNWEFLYPGPDGKFGTEDDLLMENELHVPVDKQDAVPGREVLAWFEATKAGKYETPCAELCGFGHSGMKGWLFVDTSEDYEKWVKEKWPSKE